ncbi:MAG: GcvH-related protein [Thermodesulfobacteriota bacterium]
MASIEKFLGRRVEIPEDRRYAIKQGLWGKATGNAITFGMTQPALVLSGGVKDMDWLVEAETSVASNDALVFAITGKILYVDTPIPGRVEFNPSVKENPSKILDDPYGQWWLFRIHPEGNINKWYHELSSWQAYLESLRGSEGFKNPEGKKGGVSGICKAVYTGIGEQKFST